MRFIPYLKRRSEKYIKLNLKPCLCGSKGIYVDNTEGWSHKTIKCCHCGRVIKKSKIEEAMYIWNTEYLQKFPDNGFDDM